MADDLEDLDGMKDILDDDGKESEEKKKEEDDVEVESPFEDDRIIFAGEEVLSETDEAAALEERKLADQKSEEEESEGEESEDDVIEIDEEEESGPADLSDIKDAKIKDRIMRERRIARETEESAVEAVREARTRTDDLVSKADLRVANVIVEKNELTRQGIEALIDQANSEVEAAREKGDYSGEREANEQIQKLQSMRDGLDAETKKAKEQIDKIQEFRKSYDPKDPRRPIELRRGGGNTDGEPAKGANETATKWIRSNSWFNDPQHAAARGMAMAIDSEMTNQGMNQQDPDYYLNIAKQVKRRFPEIDVRNADGKRVVVKKRQRGGAKTVNGGGEGSSRPASGTTGRVSGKDGKGLSKHDRAVMRTFNLDPANKEHVTEFLKNKGRESRTL